MRRIVLIFLAAVLAVLLSFPALGANYASQVNIQATVNPNESCLVNITATVHIDDASGELTFPVPAEAVSISLNGNSWIGVTRTEQVQYINLSQALQNMTGDFTIAIQYTLPDVVGTDAAGQPELQLPLLSGFKSPISRLNFTVSLPSNIQAKPAFSSGYHQANIEKDISCSVSGSTITGFSLVELKDHETLSMTLSVEEAMFPNAPLVFYESDSDDTALIICGIIALLYWLVFLRCLPPKRTHWASAPDGLSAGQVGAVMTLGKADLSLMVLSWGQLGYLSIHPHRGGKVLLMKQMDMGNERTAFEQRCFRELFARRDRVDTSGQNYAALCKKVSRMPADISHLVKRRSGNPKLFRAISACMGLFGGVAFGISLSQGSILQGFWVFLTAVFGLVCGWFIQQTGYELLLRKSTRTVNGLLFTALYLLLALISGQLSHGLTVCLFLWIAGLMTVFGGRRTEDGRQQLSQLLGLRRYLKTVTKPELQRITAIDPDYYHTLAPYALALGVDKAFAKHFGKQPLADCPYIAVNREKAMTATQWGQALRDIYNAMEKRRRFLSVERIVEFISVLKK